jgi:H+/Cl- antiporter ClcA
MAQQYPPVGTPPPAYGYPVQPAPQPQRSNTLLYVLLGILLGCCACLVILCLLFFALPGAILPIIGPALATQMPELLPTWEALLTGTP